MKRVSAFILLTVALLLGTPLSHATSYTFVAPLSAANESAPTGTAGTGFATVILNLVTHTMEVMVTFSGLSSGNTAAHIHCCIAPGGNTGVATTTPTFTGFPSGATSGSYDHVFDLTLASSYNPAFVTAQGGTVAAAEAALEAGMFAGLTYLNIHTTNFPGGEIRGFLRLVPEPSTLLLLGAGLAGFAVFRRRKLS